MAPRKSLWEAVESRPRPNHDEAIEDLSRVLAAHVTNTLEVPQPLAPSPKRNIWISRALYTVSLALVVTAGAYLFPKLRSVPNSGTERAPQLKEYSTAPGQRASIKLADGTQVMLNVASRIRIGNDYGVNSRTIDLIGQAQFIVTHDPKRPFTVHANGTTIRDLATTFTVRAYPGVADTRIAVRDGRVSVQPPIVPTSSAVTVEAGNVAVINPGSTASVRAISNIDGYFGWTEGRLVLNKMPLSDALLELGRWYGKDFRVADSAMLTRDDISGTFPQPLTDEGLRAIADIIGARAQRSGTTVIFFPIN